ncbi:MAG TPA: DegT/DnrJ/EryC1/StrS family aminotransferase, partial [Gaiellaceae bacterium]|nr:DegT/DnrJ/EryC1/StrS family aminotransferase [Gaiellaceae bacterium]
RLLRFHGSKAKKTFELSGYNSRLDEIQAAALRIFLRHLDEWTRLRREAAARYRELGLGDLVQVPEDEDGHVYHLFVCRSPQRDAICSALAERGIATGTYYDAPLHLQPALAYLDYGLDSLPVTEQLSRENFSVPIWAGIDADTQEQVVDAVREALRVTVA